MAKFVFQLQGVLRQREYAERQRQRDFSVAQGELAKLQAGLRELEQSQQQATGELRTNHLLGPIDLAYLAAHRRFIFAVQRKGVLLMQRIALAQRKVEEMRLLLAEAAKQRKAIEILRDKRLAAWRAAEAKKEADALDEAGTQLNYFHTDEARVAP
jgi:flagellar FliJ protein